jgi:hypothetical protein
VAERVRIVLLAASGATRPQMPGGPAALSRLRSSGTAPKAHAYAVKVMAATSQFPHAQERISAFPKKRKPHWLHGC